LKRLPPFNLIWVFYFVYYLLFGAVLARELPNYLGTKDQWLVISLFAVYGLLLAVERLISRSIPQFIYLYSVLQLGVITWLVLIPNDRADQDYFINLVLPLSGQAMWGLSEKTAKYLVLIFSIFCITSMVLYYPISDGLSFGLTYVTGCILVSVLSAAIIRSNKAQQKSQELLEELTIANQKLKDFALQVERLAVAEERNRLARELHDSVTQIIFGMTLSAQAARILIDRNPARASAELDNLQALAQNALAEMRALIQELHPHPDTDKGLVPALRQLAAKRLANDGVSVDLQLKGERRLPEHIEAELFRIAQEALNNIVKHAKADHAVITLDLEDANRIFLGIEDAGVGFDPAQAKKLPGHLGLTSMEERVQALGGTLTIDSRPGKGTRLQVVIALEQEVEHA
jgi:signal transduction histidine kinase